MRASFISAKQSVLSLLHIVTFHLLRAIKSFWLEELCRAILFELMLIGTYTHFYIRLINGIVWMIVFNFTFSRTPTAHLPDKNIAKTCAFIGTLTGIVCLYPSIPYSGNVLMYIYCVNIKWRIVALAHIHHYYLTHWGRVTHICVSKIIVIGSDNGLSPGRRQAVIWTNAGILLIGPLGTNFSGTSIEIHAFSFKKMHLKMSSAKWHLFRLGLNELTGASAILQLTQFQCSDYGAYGK